MAEPQFLSANPKAGALLSTDPNAPSAAPPAFPGYGSVDPTSDSPDPLPGFNRDLRDKLLTAAHPSTLADLVTLLAAPTDSTRGVGLALLSKVKDALPAMPSVPVRTIANKTLNLGGELLDNPIAHWLSYRAPLAGKMLKATADAIGETEAAATPTASAAAPVAAAMPAPVAPPPVAAAPMPTAPPVNIDDAIAAAKSAVGPPAALLPKPHLTAQDVMQIQSLMHQGASQAEAIAAVAKLRALGGKSFPISSVLPK